MNNVNQDTVFIECIIPQNYPGNIYNLQDQSYLRNEFIYSLESFTVNDMAKSPTGNSLPSTDQFRNAYLTLWITDPVMGQGEYIKYLPLVKLHALQNSAADPYEQDIFQLNGQIVSWDKCTITFGEALNNSAGPISFCFNIGFKFNPNNNTN